MERIFSGKVIDSGATKTIIKSDESHELSNLRRNNNNNNNNLKVVYGNGSEKKVQNKFLNIQRQRCEQRYKSRNIGE